MNSNPATRESTSGFGRHRPTQKEVCQRKAWFQGPQLGVLGAQRPALPLGGSRREAPYLSLAGQGGSLSALGECVKWMFSKIIIWRLIKCVPLRTLMLPSFFFLFFLFFLFLRGGRYSVSRTSFLLLTNTSTQTAFSKCSLSETRVSVFDVGILMSLLSSICHSPKTLLRESWRFSVCDFLSFCFAF